MPARAAGNKPTALVIEVRPPTQSKRSKRWSQPSAAASWSSLLSTMVMATAWEFHWPPSCSSRALACTMPMWGSGVPPDLLTTTTRLVSSLGPS